eukprot:7390341-Prymnesium_polylepis.2
MWPAVSGRLISMLCCPPCDDTGYDGYMRLDAWDAARPTLLQKLSKENKKPARPWSVVSSKMSRWSQSKEWAQEKTEGLGKALSRLSPLSGRELGTALSRLSPFSGRLPTRDRTRSEKSE